MVDSLLTRIESLMPKLSKGQKLIANYIQTEYGKAAFMTAARLGETVGVSESTVVRFATELGYSGYPAMQKALQEIIRGKLTSVQRIQASQDQMTGRHALGRQDESRPRRGRPGSGQGSRAFSAGDQAHPQPFARQREGAFGLDILHRGQRCGGAPIKNQYLTPQINKMLFYITK